MREIKFRAWDIGLQEMIYLDFKNIFELDSQLVGEYYDGGYLMQFTGLLDKNGKEIWEWDIVSDGYYRNVIVFGKIGYDGSWNGLSGFSYKDYYQEEGFMQLEYGDKPNKIEVLGNIYENKELLKREGEA